MSKLTKPQKNIDTVVKDYKWMFKTEYKDFLAWIKEARKNQKDTFAKVQKGDDMIKRKLGEIPETLHVMFQKRLDNDDREYLRSKKGARWFFGKFKEFRITKEI